MLTGLVTRADTLGQVSLQNLAAADTAAVHQYEQRTASPPPPSLEAQKRKGFPILQVGVAAGLASIPQLDKGVPKGYLRVLVFTKDSTLVRQRTWQLSQAANGGYEPLRLQVVVP